MSVTAGSAPETGLAIALGVRPEVAAFALRMEAKLRENDGKPGKRGWKLASPWQLLDRLREETVELEQAMYPPVKRSQTQVADEAADVGNFAMMIADVRGDLMEVRNAGD
jgi:NTP pyrophosphatase (non-canonical NTP hydrolase)